MVQIKCKNCSEEFYAKPSWRAKGHGIYCSNTCRHEDRKQGQVVKCHICSKESYKQPKALKRSKSGKFFCGKSCQTIWRNSEYVGEKHSNWKGGTHAYRRIMMQSKRESVCGLCKTTDKRILAVHHLDENRKNNAIENMAWLCHNCHHLVHHYPEARTRFMATMV